MLKLLQELSLENVWLKLNKNYGVS